jgi:hypothetical protein
MASAEGAGGSRKRVRTQEEEDEFERSTKAKIAQDQVDSRAAADLARQQVLIYDNYNLTNRNKVLQQENTIAGCRHYEYLKFKDQNERLKADLEDSGLKQENQRLRDAILLTRDELEHTRGDLVRAEARVHRLTCVLKGAGIEEPSQW